jgi:hypothetical protein
MAFSPPCAQAAAPHGVGAAAHTSRCRGKHDAPLRFAVSCTPWARAALHWLATKTADACCIYTADSGHITSAGLEARTIKDGDASCIVQLERVGLQELANLVQNDIRFALWQQPKPCCGSQLDLCLRLHAHLALLNNSTFLAVCIRIWYDELPRLLLSLGMIIC